MLTLGNAAKHHEVKDGFNEKSGDRCLAFRIQRYQSRLKSLFGQFRKRENSACGMRGVVGNGLQVLVLAGSWLSDSSDSSDYASIRQVKRSNISSRGQRCAGTELQEVM